MTKLKRVPRSPKLPMRRVPRPIIALAAGPNIRPPSIGIERKLKGGELGWTMDGNVTERMVQRALANAKMLIIGAVELETFERTLRAQQTDIAEQLKASIEKVKAEKAASQ